MAIFRQTISKRLTINTLEGHPGGLGVTLDNGAIAEAATFLTPEEVDKLVMSALIMTRPEDLDPNSEEDYEAAVDAVRVWRATRATRGSVRRRDAERDAVMKEAGYVRLTYTEAGPALRRLVDQLIEARKAGQQ